MVYIKLLNTCAHYRIHSQYRYGHTFIIVAIYVMQEYFKLLNYFMNLPQVMPLLTTITILQDQHLMLPIMLLSVLSTILGVNGQTITGKYVIGHAKLNHVSTMFIEYL